MWFIKIVNGYSRLKRDLSGSVCEWHRGRFG